MLARLIRHTGKRATRRRGASLLEYVVLVGLVSVTILIALKDGLGTNTIFTDVAADLGGSSDTGGTSATASPSASAADGSCAAGSLAGYTHPALADGDGHSATRTETIPNGSRELVAILTCDNGTVTITDETVTTVSCQPGATQTGDSCLTACLPVMYNGWQLPLDADGVEYYYKSTPIDGGEQIWQGRFDCDNGNWNYTSQTLLTVTCDPGFERDGSECHADCDAQTVNGYIVPVMQTGRTRLVYKLTDISNGQRMFRGTARCENGVVTVTGNSSEGNMCDAGYSYDGSDIACYANCPAGLSDGYLVGDLNDDTTQLLLWKQETVAHGTAQREVNVTCRDGVHSFTQRGIERTNCDPGYTLDSGTCGLDCQPTIINSGSYAGTTLGFSTHDVGTAAGRYNVINGGAQVQKGNGSFRCNNGGYSIWSWAGNTFNCGTVTGTIDCDNICYAQFAYNYQWTAQQDGQTRQADRMVPILNGEQILRATASCTGGTYSMTNESVRLTKCYPGYKELNGACYKDCDATEIDGFSIHRMDHGTSRSIRKRETVPGGSIRYSTTASCNNGIFSLSTPSAESPVCTVGYKPEGNTCKAMCQAQVIDGVQIPLTDHNDHTALRSYDDVMYGGQQVAETVISHGADCLDGVFDTNTGQTTADRCITGSYLDGACRPNCPSTMVDGVLVPYLPHGRNNNPVFKWEDIPNGIRLTSFRAECNAGVHLLTPTSQNVLYCDGGYAPSGNDCL